jgi:osmoprotectant transport system permease protein
MIVLSVFIDWTGYILDNQGQFIQLLQDHFTMVAIGELLAIVIAVPTAIAATRHPLTARLVENAGAVAQTIPALGVVALSFTALGLGQTPTILAITIYALFPMVKNTVAGIQNVDESMTRAGRGMGMTTIQRLRQIEVPLALPVIFAGIRTSTVLSIGVAYIGVFVGAGGLGVWIQAGLATVDTTIILAGAIPGALTVIFFDRVLGLAEKWVTPEGVAAGESAQRDIGGA